MNIKKILFACSSLSVIALTTTSCGGSGIKHTRSKFNDVYSVDLNHDGKIGEFVDEGKTYQEKDLTWIEAYDTLIEEANSMKDLNKIADALNIAKSEVKRTSLARYEILHEAEELAMSTGAVLPIYNYGDPYLMKPNITGIYTTNLGFKFLDQLESTDGKKDFTVSFGTKAETFDPASNSDMSTTIAINQFLIGAMHYIPGEQEEGQRAGIKVGELEEGVCEVSKKLVTQDQSKADSDPEEWIWIKDSSCTDLKDEDPDEYEGTARYTIKVKDDAVWNDGTHITADDFIYEWARASSGVYNGRPFGMWCEMFDMIRGYNVWNLIGQQPSKNTSEWSKSAQKIWNNTDPDEGTVLTQAEKNQWLQSWERNGCAGGMAGVIKNDENTFTVQLINDSDYFKSLLAFPAFMPVAKKNIILPKDVTPEYERTHICKETGDWWMNKNGSYLTNGPFEINGTIDNVDSGGIKLKKASHYTEGLAPSKVNSIEFKFIDKDSTIYDSYKSGTLQVVNMFPNSVIDDLMKKPDWCVAQQLGLFFYSINVNDNTFDIRRNMSEREREKLRQAVILLVNRDDIATNVAKKGCTAANGFVSDGIIETCVPEEVSVDPTDSPLGKNIAYKAVIDDYDKEGNPIYKTANWHERNTNAYPHLNDEDYSYNNYIMSNRDDRTKDELGFFKIGDGTEESVKQAMISNTNKAIELAKSVGIKYNEKTGKFTNFPRLNISTNNGTGLEDIAERIQAYFGLWGIDATIQTQEWQSFTATRRIGDYAIARQGWVADYNDPRTYLDLCVSSSGNNDSQLGKDSWHSSH